MDLQTSIRSLYYSAWINCPPKLRTALILFSLSEGCFEEVWSWAKKLLHSYLTNELAPKDEITKQQKKRAKNPAIEVKMNEYYQGAIGHPETL
jgi:hypothetical protein